MIAVLEIASGGLSGWPGVFGRLHPVLVHLPIGLLVVLGVLELAALRSAESSRKAQSLLATLAAFAAVVTAAAGWVLHLEEGNSETIERHEQLGIALAAVTVLAAVAHARSRGGTRRQALALYRVALAVALVLLVPTGHLGATLTHGEDYLTAPLGREHGVPPRTEHGATAGAEHGATVGAAGDDRSAGEAAEVAPVAPAGESSAAASSFERLVLPVLLERCSGCHGDTRRKGGLALHTREAIEAGSENGPVLGAGEPEHSELVRRLRLPLDDEDHMPPSNKPQPAEREVARIVAWVTAGAAFEGRIEAVEALAAAEPDATEGGPREGAAQPGAASRGAVAAGARDPAVDAAIERLRRELVHVEPLAQDSPLLWIDFAAIAPKTDDELVRTLLEPLRSRVAQLSLARTRITDATLGFCAGCGALERLDLRSTAVTSKGIEALRGHPRLAELVLVQTRLDEGAVDALLALPALRSVHLWRAGLPEGALVRLAAARRDLVVESGAANRGAPELEPPLVFVHAGPAKPAAGGTKPAGGETKPAATAAPSTTTAIAPPSALAPINTTCPVSGSPVKPEFVILFEGRAIGFCCLNCPAKFWTDPAAYRGKLP